MKCKQITEQMEIMMNATLDDFWYEVNVFQHIVDYTIDWGDYTYGYKHTFVNENKARQWVSNYSSPRGGWEPRCRVFTHESGNASVWMRWE